jgi:hypothetical protein
MLDDVSPEDLVSRGQERLNADDPEAAEAASSHCGLAWDSGDSRGRTPLTGGRLPRAVRTRCSISDCSSSSRATPTRRSAFCIGRILENRGDLAGAEAVYRPGSHSGDANAALASAREEGAVNELATANGQLRVHVRRRQYI